MTYLVAWGDRQCAANVATNSIARRLRARGALLGMVLMCVLALVACQRTTFEAPAWRDADLSTRERAQMAPDLVASGRLDGLDRPGVMDLLGPDGSKPIGWSRTDVRRGTSRLDAL
ncbi:hypothetical protein [Phenylobacterium sp.]|uniref:hypothetical protein n=1 Tax=Phenylobacterium sp. TaxID=1871053 RepID=UPI0027312AB1|nr:hypothetical protein [Phenylobacterium sp.]MDP1619228.1 hypothetical protein [Phenylobacterium sp.]MDP1986446.1 hypothetical protein [Phenylobacterium sp.]